SIDNDTGLVGKVDAGQICGGGGLSVINLARLRPPRDETVIDVDGLAVDVAGEVALIGCRPGNHHRVIDLGNGKVLTGWVGVKNKAAIGLDVGVRRLQLGGKGRVTHDAQGVVDFEVVVRV